MAQTTVALDTLGCKLNQAETESLARQLSSAGYRLVNSCHLADIYVLNTCTVTHIADRKARHLLRLARRSNPKALIVALGCYAQRAPEELSQLGAADLILGNREKHALLELWEVQRRASEHRGEDSISSGNGCSALRHRSMVKIQDGCSYFCSFCIVPYVRGRERSAPVAEVGAEVKARVAEGCKEVILTGTNIGTYGWGLPGAGLKLLIQHLLSETEIERLRLSSLQPQDLTPELLGLWGDKRLCRHFHIPLQSGCDTVLQRMRRRYSTEDYKKAAQLIREAVPGAAITTDIVVGFPGETEEEFKESLLFSQKMGFAGIHVFPYSARSGTPAAEMPDQIMEQAKRERKEKMLRLSQDLAQSFQEKNLGQTLTVLWENREGGVWSGLSDNYLRVFVKSQENIANKLLPVRLTDVCEQGLCGEIVKGGEDG